VYRAQRDAPIVKTGMHVMIKIIFSTTKSPNFDIKLKNLFSGLKFIKATFLVVSRQIKKYQDINIDYHKKQTMKRGRI
jgi:hypothetical protein